MAELKLIVERLRTQDPNDVAGIRRFHEQRATLIKGLVDTLDLDVKSWNDTDENGWPREIAEVVIDVVKAGALTAVLPAMVAVIKVWLDRKKLIDVTIEANGAKISAKGATAEDIQKIAQSAGL